MEYIFAYGTLQDGEVQEAVFNRRLTGREDCLSGYALTQKKVAKIYPVIYPAKDKAAHLQGMVYEVTQDDLKKADAYEGGGYQRVLVVLVSGTKAWAYVGK